MPLLYISSALIARLECMVAVDRVRQLVFLDTTWHQGTAPAVEVVLLVIIRQLQAFQEDVLQPVRAATIQRPEHPHVRFA